MLHKVLRPNFEKRIGKLIPAVAQDAATRQVLMVAWVDENVWRKTLASGMTTFFSTSRNRLWTKGEESGNFLKVVGMLIDCDGDALIYLVEPQGDKVACHTGALSCFYRSAITPELRGPAPREGKGEELIFALAEVDDALIGSDKDEHIF